LSRVADRPALHRNRSPIWHLLRLAETRNREQNSWEYPLFGEAALSPGSVFHSMETEMRRGNSLNWDSDWSQSWLSSATMKASDGSDPGKTREEREVSRYFPDRTPNRNASSFRTPSQWRKRRPESNPRIPFWGTPLQSRLYPKRSW